MAETTEFWRDLKPIEMKHAMGFTESMCSSVTLFEHARVNGRVPDNALPDLCPARFELWFHQRDDVGTRSKHGRDNWKDLS